MKKYVRPIIRVIPVDNEPFLNTMSGLPIRGDSIKDPTFEDSSEQNKSNNSVWDNTDECYE